MPLEEFLLRVCQYWIAACASPVRGQFQRPADQKVVKLLCQIWKEKELIAADRLPFLTYFPEHRAIQIKSKGLDEWASVKRPFRLFYEENPFHRTIRSFARDKKRYEKWSTESKIQHIESVESVIEHFEAAGISVSRNPQFVGTLVQGFTDIGTTVFGFKEKQELSAKELRAFGAGADIRFTLPGQLEPETQKHVIDDRTLRAALHISSSLKVVPYPALKRQASSVHLRLVGVPGSGKTTALYSMLTAGTTHRLALSPQNVYQLSTTAAPLLVGIDDVHKRDPSFIRNVLDTISLRMQGGDQIRLIVSYPRQEEDAVRAMHPGLFDTSFGAIDLDGRTHGFQRDVTRALCEELHVTMSDERLSDFLMLIDHFDDTPGGIKELLSNYAGMEWPGGLTYNSGPRHVPWENKFRLSSERDKTILRLIAALRTLYRRVVSYQILRELFTAYCGRSPADLDAGIIDLHNDGWFQIERPPLGPAARRGEQYLHTDDVRIPTDAFGISGTFLENLATWTRDHGDFAIEDFRESVAVAMVYRYERHGPARKAHELLEWMVATFPQGTRGITKLGFLLLERDPHRALAVLEHYPAERVLYPLLWMTVSLHCWLVGEDALGNAAAARVEQQVPDQDSDLEEQFGDADYNIIAQWRTVSQQQLREKTANATPSAMLPIFSHLVAWGEHDLVLGCVNAIDPAKLSTGEKKQMKKLQVAALRPPQVNYHPW